MDARSPLSALIVLVPLVAITSAHAGDAEKPSSLSLTQPAKSVHSANRTETLPQLIQDALASSPELAAHRADIESAGNVRQQAGLWSNPELGYLSEDRGTTSESRTIELAQRLELGGKPGARVQVAAGDFSLAELAFAKKEAEIAARTRAYYYQLGLSELRLTEAESGYELATQFSVGVERRAAAGKVAPVEAIKAKSPAFLGWNDLLLAQQEHEVALARLSSLISRPVYFSNHQQVLPPLRVLNAATLENTLVTSPGARLAKAQLDRQQSELNLQQRLAWPDVQLRAGAKTTLQDNERSYSFAVSVPLPLFNRNQGAIAAAASKVSQVESMQRESLRTLRLELGEQVTELNGASRGVELYEQEVVPAAETAYRAARQGYELGRFPFLDVLDAQRTLVNARSERLAQWGRYIDAMNRIEAMLGKSLTELSLLPLGATQ